MAQATAKPSAQQGGSTASQQQPQQQAGSTKGQQQGGQIFRDWAAI